MRTRGECPAVRACVTKVTILKGPRDAWTLGPGGSYLWEDKARDQELNVWTQDPTPPLPQGEMLVLVLGPWGTGLCPAGFSEMLGKELSHLFRV